MILERNEHPAVKRRIFCILTILCLTLAACAPTAPAGNGSEQTQSVSFTDDLGRTVTGGTPPAGGRPHRAALPICGSWPVERTPLVAAADDAWTSFDLNLDEDVVRSGAA